MNEPVKLVPPPQNLDCGEHPVHDEISAPAYRGAEKQPPRQPHAIQIHEKFSELLRLERCPAEGVGTAIHAVVTVVQTLVGHEHLEEWNFFAVRHRGGINPPPHGAPHAPRHLIPSAEAVVAATDVVLRRLTEYLYLVLDLLFGHGAPPTAPFPTKLYHMPPTKYAEKFPLDPQSHAR